MSAPKYWENILAPKTASNPRLDAALAYATKLQWLVLPLYWVDEKGNCACGNAKCLSPGKHPYRPFVGSGENGGGFYRATKDVGTLSQWFGSEPRCNIGIRMGETSGVVAMDVDPRNGGDALLAKLLEQHGALPETVTAVTGGGGQHYIFKYEGQDYKSPGRGVDMKSDGYIVVWPSIHKSGQQYFWEGAFDPFEGATIASPPHWFPVKPPRGNLSTIPEISGQPIGHLEPWEIERIKSALKAIVDPGYEQWRDLAFAISSTDVPEAWEIFHERSMEWAKYDHGAAIKLWNSCRRCCNGITIATLFYMAKDAGWEEDAPTEPTPSKAADFTPPILSQIEGSVPSHLLTIPGALGDLVSEINRSAPKKQPEFAVETALALGSVVCGRRYVAMPSKNYSSLYFVAVGEQSCGKENINTVVEEVLTDSGLQSLIGPSGYASESGIMSALWSKPAHISVIDEFGAMLENSQAAGNFYKRQSIELLKTAWGRLHSVLRPQAFSTNSLTTNQKKELQKEISRPALTFVGLTTPNKFYESLTEHSIQGGFLSRLIIVESGIGAQFAGFSINSFSTPKSVVEWCKATRQGVGNLSAIEVGADIIPPHREAQIAPDAIALFDAYEREILARKDELAQDGLGGIDGRSREKSLRVALIVAVSDDPINPIVTAKHAAWAIDYVRYYTAQTIRSIRAHMVGGKFSKFCADALKVIFAGKERGRTIGQIYAFNRSLRELDRGQMKRVLDTLIDRGEISLEKIVSKSGRGSPRMAYVARKPLLDDAEDNGVDA